MPLNLDFNTFFVSRADATSQLIEILPAERMVDDDWLIVAISENAVPLANMISHKLNLSFDILLNEPIYAPNNEECEIAMVSESEDIVIHEALVKSFEINLDYIYGQAHRIFEDKIVPKAYKYRKGDLLNSIENRNILFVNMGVDIGLKEICCIKTAINMKATSIALGTPIIPTDVYNSLETVVDEIFVVKKIDKFVDVEFYYENLSELSQDDIIEILKNSKGYLPFQKNRRDLDEI